MSRRWSKKNILTVPNAMSLVRLALIPLYLWLYVKKELYGWSLAVLLLSGFTDMLDGRVARQFGQESDLGKILDPVADKLTQAALILSLAGRYPHIRVLFILFAVKELLVAGTGLAVLVKTDQINSARWFGKASTAVLEISMGVLILFPHIAPAAADILMGLSAVMLIIAGVGYMLFYVRLIRAHARGESGDASRDHAA